MGTSTQLHNTSAEPKILFKALIRVVKSLTDGFGVVNVLKEPLIEARDKNAVKEILLEKYPQFFQNGRVYEKETKDNAQFFYVVIYPLFEREIALIHEGQWICSYCGHVHENKYLSRPQKNERLLGGDLLFCGGDDHSCLSAYIQEKYSHAELPDDINYIKNDGPNYIYKCTEKSTSKCYIGKTRNAPFFRWWNHLTRNGSPFGLHLRNTRLSDWTFEVLEELPAETPDAVVFRIESEYINKFDSINNGYNTVISTAQCSTQPTDPNALQFDFDSSPTL